MDKQKQQLRIDNIDWDKDWNDLSYDEQANYLGLKNIGCLTVEMKPKVIELYNLDRYIVAERGKDRLSIYLEIK